MKKRITQFIILLLCCSINIHSQNGFTFYGTNKNKQQVSFKLINNLIVIPLEINGKELSFILDTGVNKTILFNLTKNDSLGLKNIEKVELQGLGDGEPVEALLSKNNILKIKNIMSGNESIYVILRDRFDFSGKMGVTIHGIIGYNLLKDLIAKINYKSNTPALIRVKINETNTTEYTLPASTVYTDFTITDCIQVNSDFTIESLSIFNLYIDSINLKDDDGEITCQPTAGLNANSAYSEPLEYIAVGQGFFISGDQDGGPIVFNNSQRENIVEGAQSTFFKSNIKHKKKVTATRKQLPILKLGMNYTGQTGTELHRQIGISFKYNNSFKYDKGYDSFTFDVNNTDFYWKFSDNSEKYAITGIQNITEDLEVPLEIIIGQDDEISLEIDEINFDNSNLYILDKLENKTYNLKEGKVKFNLPKGEYTDRFFLAFKESVVLSTEDNILTNDFSIFYNKTDKNINIELLNGLEMSKVNLYSILGQEINTWSLNNENKKILDVKNLSKAIYIIKIKTNRGDVSKKILIN